MCNELISRKAAIDAIEEMQMSIMRSDFSGDQFIFTGMSRALQVIKKLPTAQPERKKGKWITVQGRLGNEVECNQCHSVFWYWIANYRFCAHCGADMRTEGKDDN